MPHKVVLIPGDGIGPEVAAAVCKVLEASRAPVRFIERYAGTSALERGALDVLPDETLDAIREHHVALKGPCSTPIGGGFRSVNVGLRKKLDLYAAVRPVRSMPGVATRYEGVDLVIIRENTEGLYSGVENEITDGVVASMKVATRKGCQRISRWAFRYAKERKRRRVTALHKANIMKLTDGMFIDQARTVHDDEYPDVEYSEMIIDAAAMRLVQDPTQFDVLLCENLYGDIMSDLCSAFVGGLGVSPGANIGDADAVFEAVHGSAPDIAGQNVANPLALLMSATMMLNHLAATRVDPTCRAAADRIKSAYNRALEQGDKTGDLGGKLSTTGFADAVIARMQ